MKTYTDVIDLTQSTPDVPVLKKCPQCGTPKNIDDFYAGRNQCKTCIIDNNMQNYHDRKKIKNTRKVYEIAEKYKITPFLVRCIIEMWEA